MSEIASRPFQHSPFAVWRWPRWLWAVLMLISGTGYLAVPSHAIYLLTLCGQSQWVNPAKQTILWPAIRLSTANKSGRDFYNWQWRQMAKLFGKPQRDAVWVQGGIIWKTKRYYFGTSRVSDVHKRPPVARHPTNGGATDWSSFLPDPAGWYCH